MQNWRVKPSHAGRGVRRSTEAGAPEQLKILLRGGIGLLRGGKIAGLQGLAQLANRVEMALCSLEDWAEPLVMMMVIGVARSLLLAGLVDILLHGGKVRLCGGDVNRFRILRKLRDRGCQRIAALGTGGGSG
jgi:hypothetical protein